MGEKECMGCIGFDVPHSCEGWSQLQDVLKHRYDCTKCPTKDRQIEELQAQVGELETAFKESVKLERRLNQQVSELQKQVDEATTLCAYKEKQIMRERKRRQKLQVQVEEL